MALWRERVVRAFPSSEASRLAVATHSKLCASSSELGDQKRLLVERFVTGLQSA